MIREIEVAALDRRIEEYFPYRFEISPLMSREIIVEWCHSQFGDSELITIHSGDRRTLIPINVSWGSRLSPMQLFNEWAFSEDQLAAARFTYYGQKFFFKHASDAVLFKLRWG